MALSVGMMLLSVIGVVYGIIPASGRILEFVDQRRSLMEDVQALQTKLAVLESVDEAAIRNSVLILLSAVPSDKSIPSIFSTVERTALAGGAVIDTIAIANPGSLATESAQKQSSEEKKLGSGIIAFTVSVNGTPKEIRDFLDQAVRVRRFLRLRFAELSFFSGTSVTLRAGMDAFWAPLPASLGDTLRPVQQLTQSEEALMKTLSAFPSFTAPDAGPATGSAALPLSPDLFAPLPKN